MVDLIMFILVAFRINKSDRSRSRHLLDKIDPVRWKRTRSVSFSVLAWSPFYYCDVNNVYYSVPSSAYSLHASWVWLIKISQWSQIISDMSEQIWIWFWTRFWTYPLPIHDGFSGPGCVHCFKWLFVTLCPCHLYCCWFI